MNIKPLTYAAIALSVAAIAGTQRAAAADTWSYADCVEYARANNISLMKLRLAEQTSEADLDEAKAQWQPSLDFATTQGYSNYPWGQGSRNNYTSSYGLNAGWTVWNGGEREKTIEKNRLQTRLSEINTADAFRTIETDLLQVYVNILYARESIGIYEEAARLSYAQADRARQLMEAGRLSRVDYAQFKSQYEQDNYALVNARGLYQTRCMEMKTLLELGIDTDIELADVEWTAEQVVESLPDMAESYQMALATDLRIRGLELESESAGLDVGIAKAGRLPKITLNAGVGTGYNAPGQSFADGIKRSVGESVGLTLSLPIFDNRRTRSAVARAKIRQLDADLDISRRHTELAQAVENWFIDTRSAQARFTAALQQLESAQLTDELTNEQFALGLVNTVELIQSHVALTESRHTLLQAKFMAMLGHKMIEYYRTATVSLQ